jgi:hypothetical protein
MPNRGPQAEGGSKLLMPLLLLLVAAVAVWYFFLKPKGDTSATHPANTALANPTTFATNLTGMFTKMTDTLNGVKDEATATEALPKLQGFSSDIDNMKALFDKIPEAARGPIKTVVTEHLGKFKDLVAKILAMPGVGEKLKPVVDGIVSKLGAFGA